jgi:predicted TPR repeat methyltransferase
MRDERLQWIYASTTPDELQERYDAWAADYDDDLDSMAWTAPKACAVACLRHTGANATVLDAGCGTGLVGAALRTGGAGRVVGFDLSVGMLRRAADRHVYDELVQGSLLEPLAFPAGSFDAVTSVGVFTFGHVGPEGVDHMIEVVRPNGFLAMTFRDDVYRSMGFDSTFATLIDSGRLVEVERSSPGVLLVEDGEPTPMWVGVWKTTR